MALPQRTKVDADVRLSGSTVRAIALQEAVRRHANFDTQDDDVIATAAKFERYLEDGHKPEGDDD